VRLPASSVPASSVSLTCDDASELKVVALDLNGYPRKTFPGGADRIELLPDCLYYVITEQARRARRSGRGLRGGLSGLAHRCGEHGDVEHLRWPGRGRKEGVQPLGNV